MTNKPRKPVTVGTIWYHPLAGPDRPFIVRAVEGGYVYSDNLDDGATQFKHKKSWVEEQEHLD